MPYHVQIGPQLLTGVHIGRTPTSEPPRLLGSSGKCSIHRVRCIAMSRPNQRNTRRLTSAVSTYEYFCSMQGQQAWPPTIIGLGQYVVTRAWGTSDPRLQCIKPDSIRFHL